MFNPKRLYYSHTVLALCTLGFLSTMVARVVISPVVPALTDDFAVSTGAIGLALSGMWAAYAFTQFPSGVLADRKGERIVVLTAIGATGVTSLLLALSPAYVLFFVFAVALGAATGFVYTAAASLVTKQSPDTGRAIGIYIAGGPIAGLIAPPIAAAVAVEYGWSAAVAIGAVAAVPVFVLFWRGIEPTPPARSDTSLRDQLDLETFTELLSRPPIVFTVLLAVLGAFTWQAVASFLPAFLEMFHGFSRTGAGLLFSAYFVIHGATQPVTGALSDRYSRDATALLTMVVGTIGFSLLLVGTALFTIILAISLIGLAMSWGAPLQSKFMDNFSTAEQGTGFGLVRTIYMGLGSFGSAVTGILVDFGGWMQAFGLLAVLMAIGAILLTVSLLDQYLPLTLSVSSD
ncbi:MFS transporter [Halobacteria archaeon AArc-curdl1]|uniref:MFS transporter n=1 Tax=Natronosalvus hydrolyticus TaxID=2979988 RepID=A0AAP3E6M1_9EURY|nr:MFS transporter [Halobacteria archaeon AArc-curdl1]